MDDGVKALTPSESACPKSGRLPGGAGAVSRRRLRLNCTCQEMNTASKEPVRRAEIAGRKPEATVSLPAKTTGRGGGGALHPSHL